MSGDIEATREWTVLRSSLLDDLQEAIIITDIEGHVVCWNKSAERLYQWAESEVLGERMIDFLLSDREADFVRGIAHAVNAGSRWEGIFPARSKDGTPLPSAAVAIPIRDAGGHVTSGVMIINAAGAGNDEYQRFIEVERKDRDTFENSVVGIFQTTGSGQFLKVNATLARMLGYDSPRDFTSNVTSDLDIHVEPEKREEFLRMIEEQGSGGILETQLYRKDGQKIWVQVSARAARGEDGDVAFYEGSMQDVTELKLLEEQLKQSQTMEAIGRLAGGVAHDFNNLLTAINGYGQLLVSRLNEGDPCYGYANEILRAANRATALTGDLLTFSRKPAGQTDPIDLNPVVADLAKMLSRVIGEHINISTNLSPALGHLKGDRSQIERVLMNLAVNARDAMPEGGCIAMTTENVRVRASQASRHPGVPPGPYVLLTVADTGVGIDKQTISHIFEPFFTTKGKGKGTGLGLSTAYAIVRQYGGHIIASSQPGSGTTFKIYFPRISGGTGPLSIPAGEMPVPLGTETILLVEDEPTVRAYTAIVLRELGYSVLEAGDGEEALGMIANRKGRIDLLLTDVVMPKMGGKQLSDIVKSHWPDVRVLFYSGYTGEALSGKIAAGEEESCLQKPFTKAELARFVRTSLDSKLSK